MDEALREAQGRFHGKRFLHADRIPLRNVDLRTAEDRGQLDMFNMECEGMCGV